MASAFFAVITSIVLVFEGLFGMFANVFTKDVDYTQFTQCKNIIFMIGDGMGFNSLEKAKAELGIELAMDTFPLQGESKTRSTSSSITDSAAGATALSCATRTTNGCLCVYNYDTSHNYSHPKILTEVATEQGKATGIVTTDKTSGATPAGFSVHTSSRNNEEDITTQQMNSDSFTLIWGTSTDSFSADTVYSNGWDSVITNKAEMDALTEGGRSFGQFTDELWHTNQTNSMPTLAEMTEKAIDLLDDDEDGFFLMVEGAHIDKNSHSNIGDGMDDALNSFDNAVEYALSYAETHGDTLVLVTADHETGGITLTNGSYVYTTTSHTGVNVPLRIYGCDNFLENGEAIDNKEASKRVAAVMGCYDFPARVYDDSGC